MIQIICIDNYLHACIFLCCSLYFLLLYVSVGAAIIWGGGDQLINYNCSLHHLLIFMLSLQPI